MCILFYHFLKRMNKNKTTKEKDTCTSFNHLCTLFVLTSAIHTYYIIKARLPSVCWKPKLIKNFPKFMEVPHSFPIVMFNMTHIVDILYGGVDFTLPGNGGKECVEYLTLKQRIIETVVYELFTVFVFYKILGKVSMPKELPVSREGNGAGKRFLLVLLCVVFGIEIGFKFATKQVIFLLNPCHVVTVIQVSGCNYYRV